MQILRFTGERSITRNHRIAKAVEKDGAVVVVEKGDGPLLIKVWVRNGLSQLLCKNLALEPSYYTSDRIQLIPKFGYPDPIPETLRDEIQKLLTAREKTRF